MALELDQDFHGFTANYWVAEAHANKMSNKTFVRMLLFKDATARGAGASFLTEEPFHWEIAGCYKTGPEVYAAVKASHLDANDVEQNKFAAAEDC